MTLITILKTDDQIVMGADGMGFSQGGGGHVPYSVNKLHTANSVWIFANCGWAGTVAHQQQLEGEISAARLEFDSDIDIGGIEYLKELHKKCEPHMPRQGGTTFLLAGVGAKGLRIKVAELNLDDEKKVACHLLEAPDITAYGSQANTAKWILKTFSPCCRSAGDYKDLACFAIWQVAEQEITQGQLPRYAISTAIIPRSGVPIVETPDPSKLRNHLNSRLASVREAYSNS